MPSYQSLSIVQFLFILLCGISVLDFGVDLNDDDNSDLEDATGLGFNQNLFKLTCAEDDEDSDDFSCENKYWGVIQFWGYCMIIVAILQLMKAFSVENF